MEYFEISKGVVVFKNVLNNPQNTYELIKKSQIEKNSLFSDWVKWGSFGLKSILNPFDYKNLETNSGQFIEELRSIFSECFTIYKDKYINLEYHKTLDIDPYFYFPDTSKENLFSLTQRKIANDWGPAYFLVGDYADSFYENGLMYEYHLDRTPFWGTPPYAYSLNVYPNDNYSGGELSFIDMSNAEKKITTEGITYYLIDKPIQYKPKAGDAILFPSLQYHATFQTFNGQKIFIRMHMQSPNTNSYINEIKYMSKKEIQLKQENSFKKCMDNGLHLGNIVYEKKDIILSNDKSVKFIIKKEM